VVKVMELNIEQILQSERAWEYVLLDIVKSEDLDPWDIDIVTLTHKYMERINKMKELDLRVPARLILAAAILMKMQSEQLLIGEDQEELIDDSFLEFEPELDVDASEEDTDLPLLDLRIRRKPVRKVTLSDLIDKLKRSMEPKQKKEKHVKFELDLPAVDITAQIDDLYGKIIKANIEKVAFSTLIPNNTNDDVIDTLLPLLHLANEHRVELEQEKFFEEIFVTPIKT